MPEVSKKTKIILITIVILALSAMSALFLLPDKKFNAGDTTINSNSDDSQDISENSTEETKQLQDFAVKETEETASTENKQPASAYPVHKNIMATIFWIGEKASDDNKEISNKSSAWDDEWRAHYGGTDDPKKRKGFYPVKFIPNENPFYFALPYNDFDVNANRRENSEEIPWVGEKSWQDKESMVKNRWIKIVNKGNACYGQWEDVGPFKENDFEYVFGNNAPKSTTNKNAGLDVSPALRDCLGLKDLDKIDWQFIDFKDVPDGPWKKIITSSNIYWK